MQQIYVDNAATTAVSEQTLSAMLPYFSKNFANPSAIHYLGLEAKKTLEASRGAVAKALGALSSEIYFTSGGTESNNWAVHGLAALKLKKGRHIISTEIEHKAILNPLNVLKDQGFQITLLKPDNNGQITPQQLENAIKNDTIFISIMTANNVVGTILPINELAKVANKHKIIFHTDSVQAIGHIPINVRSLGIDLLSLSAHKFHGPKGVGVLFSKVPLVPQAYFTGGGQERGHRSGTENIPGIVGLAAAIEEATRNLQENNQYLKFLRHKLIDNISQIPQAHLTGDPINRLPGHVSFVFEGLMHSVYLINELSDRGICASSGSACSASSTEAPHVLLSMGYESDLAHNALRITISKYNTESEIDYISEQLKTIIPELRRKNIRKRSRIPKKY
jgi:cysteine desulfurase